MNTTHHRSAWAIALASVALTVTTACGSEIATEPANVGGVAEQASAERTCADNGGPGGGLRPPASLPDGP